LKPTVRATARCVSSSVTHDNSDGSGARLSAGRFVQTIGAAQIADRQHSGDFGAEWSIDPHELDGAEVTFAELAHCRRSAPKTSASGRGDDRTRSNLARRFTTAAAVGSANAAAMPT